jgi:dephospho-CoA kinase
MASKLKGKYLIGITGNIGSGKSKVASLLEELGAIRISSDEIAKQFTDPDSPIKEQLRSIFGNLIFDEKNSPIKNKIAELAFADKSKLVAMNSLIHPLVREQFLSLVEKSKPGSIIAWEAPLLFETDAHLLCDATVCVTASPTIAWERVQMRGGMTKEDFEKRNLVQLDIDKKKSLSDFVLPNDNSIEELKKITKEVFEKIKNKAKGIL